MCIQIRFRRNVPSMGGLLALAMLLGNGGCSSGLGLVVDEALLLHDDLFDDPFGSFFGGGGYLGEGPLFFDDDFYDDFYDDDFYDDYYDDDFFDDDFYDDFYDDYYDDDFYDDGFGFFYY